MELIVSDFVMKTAVAFFVYNRLDTTQIVFERIREIKPPRLYLICDAARPAKEGDTEKVAAVREFLDTHVDWDCEVHKNYAETNMGCKNRVSSGINWVFEHEEEAIIIEDDVLLDISFFRFCQEMLEHYRNDPKVMMVGAHKKLENYKTPYDYLFTADNYIWGWGTWRSTWEKYDVTLKNWPQRKAEGLMRKVFMDAKADYVEKELDLIYEGKLDTWDYQLMLCLAENDGLCVVPNVNLINNIGMNREDATHTKGPGEEMHAGAYHFPIKFRDKVERDIDYDIAVQKDIYYPSFAKKVVRKLKRMFGKA